MAPELTPCKRADLLKLEDRLLDHGFGFLLSILPRELFLLHDRNVVLRSDSYSLQDTGRNPSFAFIDGLGQLHVNIQNSEDADSSSSLAWRTTEDILKIPLFTLEDRLAAFNDVEPMLWHGTQDSDHSGSREWVDQTTALIKYFLLRWASDNDFTNSLAQPDYDHLRAALAKLRETRHYKTKEIIYEDEERLDVQTSVFIGDNHASGHTQSDDGEDFTPKRNDHENSSTSVDHTAHTQRAYSITCLEKSGHNKSSSRQPDALDDITLLTPDQSQRETTIVPDNADSIESSTRDASVTSATMSGADTEVHTMDLLDNETAMSFEADTQARRFLPTPDTIMEESTAAVIDPIMVRLRKEVGREPLSLLPDLNAVTFKKIHQGQPGFLCLRLLIGTLQSARRPHLDGSEVWASFKMHDKGARAAPRMHAHVFRAHSDEVIDDKLDIKQALPDLRLGTAFNGVHGGGRLEELQLKALVKYFFILAASSKLLGFTKHCMPFNGSFVDQLKIVCKRLQTHGTMTDHQRVESRPVKRLKRTDSRPSRVSSSLSDADDDAALTARTQNARRSGRRVGQPSSTAVSESEDNGLGSIESTPQYLPRRLALGAPIIRHMVDYAQNEFLNPGAQPADSEGDSGDEIPASIPVQFHDLLRKRQRITSAMEADRETVRALKSKKESFTMGIRKFKGMLKNCDEPLVRAKMEHELKHRQKQLWCVQSQIAVREGAHKGFKARRKELNEEASWVDPRLVEAWEGLELGR